MVVTYNQNHYSMTTTTLHSVSPRSETVENITNHAVKTHDIDTTDIPITSTVLNHTGKTLEATFECPYCTYDHTEIYTLRYIDQVNGDTRLPRGETPVCVCDNTTENNVGFNEIERKKKTADTAVAVAECDYCSETWEDVFKYQRGE